MLSYFTFPPREIIVSRLRRIEGGAGSRDELFAKIAETLQSRTLDAAAFSFLLIELMHRHEDLVEEDLATFIPKCVDALTGDRELSQAARDAFDELGRQKS
ncbi:MAG: hypothetical protein OES47_08400 [Acidobacteriota bacterium]|nr:hypothetical protein [Acidobacteriota bacterium]